MERTWLPVTHAWQLNERHYGALQGLDKAETARRYGDAQVLAWRRSYDVPPPPLEADDPRSERGDPRYASLPPGAVPLTECLADTVARVLPFWHTTLAPAVAAGERLLIAAHGNSMRALVKHLDGISDEEIVGLNIPNGIPLVYEFDARMNPVSRRYLGDAATAAKAAAAVAAQASSSG
jgi:2,3-bisphosphoglycerate-dependent phosphoglycerate mutase